MRPVSTTERRARLGARHRLAPWARADSAAEVAESLVALHGTDPASVFLAVWARTSSVDSAQIERALYEDRMLVRMLGMRRTMFVVPVGLAAVVQAACTNEVARRMRRQLAARLEQAGITADGEGWLEQVGDAVLRVLAARGAATGVELSRDEPRLREQIVVAAEKSYGGPGSVASRVLMLLSAEGRIVRGRPRGGWTSSQFQWFPASAWLGGRPANPSAATARAELARRWLSAFGPARVSDLQWWAGWTARQVKAALSQVRVTDVDLDGGPGIILADDEGPVAAPEPWPALLPALDATAMGWRDRRWFTGGHESALFDRSGNIGPTAWWDGQIVGGWAQRRDGEIVLRLLDDRGADATKELAAQAHRLQAWLGPVRITPRFRTPLERELSA